jgi:basic membrane lipoprotein Med (substrate-binding protein (PBP1-ABC) superfamily)
MATALAIMLGACTGGTTDNVTPAPSAPGTEPQAEPTRIAVVLPPAGTASDEAVGDLRAGISMIAAAAGVGDGLRVVQPDGPEFVADVATVLAADGYRLVCVLGAAALDEVAAAAAAFPGTRFCIDADRAIETTGNIWAPRPRYGEASWLVGVTAALLGGDVVGVIVREGEPALNAKRPALVAGHRAVLAAADPGAEPVAPVVGTIASNDQAVSPVVEAVLSQEPTVLVVDVGSLGGEVLELLADQAPSTTIIQWIDGFQEVTGPPGSVVVLRDRLAVFRLALEALLDGTFTQLPETIGVAEGIHSIRPARADDDIPVLAELDTWVEAVLRGEVDLGAAGP